MKSVLLYYPFVLAENVNSGSKLRPRLIYEAFQLWGKEKNIEILLLSGTSKEREHKFESWRKSGKLNNILFCYMENQTIPLWLTDEGHIPRKPFIDKKVLSFLKRRGVPIGVFYRDVYWKFDELYPLKGLKKKIMQLIYRLEEKFYEKYCDVIFLPSIAMGAYVNINRKKVALPPGGKKRNIKKIPCHQNVLRAIYVGGVKNKDHGLPLLLDALKVVNKDSKECDLTIVCRKNEYEELEVEKKEALKQLDVNVKHLSGEELDALYLEMDFALIPRYRTVYNDFSVPVKLVEYLSNELPVIATNCEAQKEFIMSGGYGIICNDEPKDLANAIIEMKKRKNEFVDNIQKTFFEQHSWIARVRKVEETLIQEEQ